MTKIFSTIVVAASIAFVFSTQLANAQSGGKLQGVIESVSESSGTIVISDKKYRFSKSTRITFENGSKATGSPADYLQSGTPIQFSTDSSRPHPRLRQVMVYQL